MWTFKQVFDKLTGAYIHGKVHPFDPCTCFVGNLLNGTCSWQYARNYQVGKETGIGVLAEPWTWLEGDQVISAAEISIKRESEETFTPKEIADIEAIFMHTFYRHRIQTFGIDKDTRQREEEVLWEAFNKGLDKVKEIFISKGLPVEDEIVLPKRWLKQAV